MMPRLSATLASEKVRFLVAGVSTTLFSYALYLGLLQLLAPTPAYVLAYVAGIAWAYAVNSAWVFKGEWTWRGLAAYPLVYLAQAVVSIALFELLIRNFSLPAELVPMITIVAMLPVNYVLGRALVRRTSPGRDRP